MEFDEKRKSELLEGVALTVDFDSLTPEEQIDILRYIEYIKNKNK